MTTSDVHAPLTSCKNYDLIPYPVTLYFLLECPVCPNLGAGLLMYRKGDRGPEVLLVHPGEPFLKNKDPGVWSLPKGLADKGEVGEQLPEVANLKLA